MLTAENMSDKGAELLCKAIFGRAISDYIYLKAADEDRRMKGFGSRTEIIHYLNGDLASYGTQMNPKHVVKKLEIMSRGEAIDALLYSRGWKIQAKNDTKIAFVNEEKGKITFNKNPQMRAWLMDVDLKNNFIQRENEIFQDYLFWLNQNERTKRQCL